MSCLANYDIEEGDAFVAYTPEANTTYGQAKECAQQCQLDGRCDGFTLSYSRACELRTGRFFSDFPYVSTSPYETAASPAVNTPSNDVILSCLKNAVDFEGAGRYGSVQIAGAIHVSINMWISITMEELRRCRRAFISTMFA